MFVNAAPPASLRPGAAHLPFVRADAFSSGWRHASLRSRAALLAGSAFLLPLRVVLLAFVVVPLGFVSLVALLLPVHLRIGHGVAQVFRAAARRWVQTLAALTLHILSVRVRIACADKPAEGSAGDDSDDSEVTVHVSNHVSWIDILVFTALLKPSFVAAAFVWRVPVVGRVAAALDCIMVDEAARTSEGARYGTVAALQQRGRARLEAEVSCKWQYPPLLVFPEGTTTNGQYLLRFRTGAFRIPGKVRAWMLHYSSPLVSAAWESIPAAQHLFLMLSQPFVCVTVQLIGTYGRQESEDPSSFNDRVRVDMSAKSEFTVQLSDATYSDKMAYHTSIFRAREDSSKLD